VLINKFRAKKNKAAFAQTLIRKLEKLERIEVEQEDVAKMNFKFPPAPHSGKLSLTVKEVSKNYDDLQVIEKVNLEVIKGEKIAFVGKNGEGKTTLAKIIVDEIDFQGDVKLGHKINVGYYAQNQTDFLDENKSVLQCIEGAANTETSPKVRDILGSFLFSNEDVDKKIKVLSGGERARVALCKLLLDPINLLIMDEPTNHLDMTSKDILKRALKSYDGTLILVSHDRDFLQGLTEKVYEFKNKNIKEYIGDINAFLQERDLSDFKELERKEKKSTKKLKQKEQLSYQQKKDEAREKRKLQNRINKLEKKIEKLEKELKQLDKKLADAEKFKELSQNPDFFSKYEQKQKKMKDLEQNWENMNLKLNTLNSHL
jgi:ATP-binding cassette subfamily F protein 3